MYVIVRIIMNLKEKRSYTFSYISGLIILALTSVRYIFIYYLGSCMYKIMGLQALLPQRHCYGHDYSVQ